MHATPGLFGLPLASLHSGLSQIIATFLLLLLLLLAVKETSSICFTASAAKHGSMKRPCVFRCSWGIMEEGAGLFCSPLVPPHKSHVTTEEGTEPFCLSEEEGQTADGPPVSGGALNLQPWPCLWFWLSALCLKHEEMCKAVEALEKEIGNSLPIF